MSPVSAETIRSAIRYSGKESSGGASVVAVEVVVEAGTVVAVVEVAGAFVVVVAAGSFDDVHEATTSANAISR